MIGKRTLNESREKEVMQFTKDLCNPEKSGEFLNLMEGIQASLVRDASEHAEGSALADCINQLRYLDTVRDFFILFFQADKEDET